MQFTIKIEIFFSKLCGFHYPLISQAFSHESLCGFPTLDLLCELILLIQVIVSPFYFVSFFLEFHL
jgi:hypothetical protein